MRREENDTGTKGDTHKEKNLFLKESKRNYRANSYNN